MLDILFLGTGASVPSRSRALPSIAVRCSKEIYMFDCGEGTQRQMMISPFSFMKIKAIFITHMHGDHVFGLPGLLQTMGLSGRKDPLVVYGPEGFPESIQAMMDATEGEIPYQLEYKVAVPGDVIRLPKGHVTAFKVDHNIPALGYRFIEDDIPSTISKTKADALGIDMDRELPRLKNGETIRGVNLEMVMGNPRPGCSVMYTGDTLTNESIGFLAKDLDVLIHESTYCESESELAKQHWHSTAKQAAESAKEAGCRKLILTHISNRYDDRSKVLAEARSIFPETMLAEDMLLLNVTKNSIRSI